MTVIAFNTFKKRALKFVIRDGHFWRRNNKSHPRRVIDSSKERTEIMKAAHEDLGHKGRESTYHHVGRNFWWEKCYLDCKKFVASCIECQMRNPANTEEALYSTYTGSLFTKLAIDMTLMPMTESGFKYLALA
ncbi:hypothetical protein OnM2_017052 [Erysiphe neolycopersici]|uniref:Integrase zinc-binding domain-containing protein n=1 Tax=Erysiphe neolycopersici TaxID=212602 RepID=A0A420I4M7_9PEZI|nr:hypothetical protein OnM2_017052 [Erysiphe neolycopersici]